MDIVRTVGGHLFSSLKVTGLQIFVLLGPGLILALLMHYVARVVEINANRLLGQRLYLALFAWLGTAVHELGHAAMCPLFGHRITDMKLFSPDPATGTLGYVNHSYNPDSFYHNVGNFFIGIGPIISGTVVIYVAARFLLSDTFFDSFAQLKITYENFSSLQASQQLALSVWESTRALLLGLFTAENALRWQFYLFLYILFSVGSSITLSPPDIQGAVQGFAVFFGVLFIVNIIALVFGGISIRYFIWITQYYSVTYAVLVFALIMNALVCVPLLLLRGGAGLSRSV